MQPTVFMTSWPRTSGLLSQYEVANVWELNDRRQQWQRNLGIRFLWQ
jgi:hypothetical protein